MEVRLLGPVEVRCGGRPVQLPGGRELSLLAVLLVHCGTPVAVQRLLDLLWEGDPPAGGRGNLQAYVSRLRRRLAEAGSGIRIVTRGATYTALVAGGTDLDAFRKLVDAARNGADQRDAAELLADAMRLCRGAPLANVPDSVRDRVGPALQEEVLAATEDLADAQLALDRHAEHAPTLTHLVEAHPYRERLVGQLMLALYRSGRPADALACYRAFADRLATEHGADPGASLAALHQRILQADPGLRPPPRRAPGPPDTTVDEAETGRDPVGPRLLPSAPPHFVGRWAEAAALTAALAPTRAGPTPVRIAVVSGSAGTGKTSLALHWAEQHAGTFPDGQLYVNLRGFDPVSAPKDPAAAVLELLLAMGTDAARIPADVEARQAVYRDRLAGTSTLLVLDNARDEQQVRPLLPGAGNCAALVTSRHRLPGLAVAEGATPVPIGVLSTAEGVALLERRIGASEVAAHPAAVDAILRTCARLPLALAVVAARAASARLALAAVAAELTSEQHRMDALSCDDPTVDVRSVFSWSYRILSPRAAGLFRLLSHHAGPDITVAAAASLAGQPPERAALLLAELSRTQLITETEPGRYDMHDLLLSYARELDRTNGSPAARGAAGQRLLHHHLHSLVAANTLAFPHRQSLEHPLRPAGVTVPVLHDREDAIRWFAANRAVLAAAAHRAADEGHADHAWRLAWLSTAFLDRDGRWLEAIAAHRVSLAAARRADNPLGEAYAHRGLTRALTALGQPDQSLAHAAAALRAFTRIGDLTGAAAAQYDLSIARWRMGDLPAALAAAQDALRRYRAAGDSHGEADSLNAISWYHSLTDDYRQALRYGEQAASLMVHLDNTGGQAATLDTLGHIHHRLGEYAEAVALYRQALELQRAMGDRFEESMVLTHLGDTYLAQGQPGSAGRVWRSAHTILIALAHPEAAAVREKLHTLPGRLAE